MRSIRQALRISTLQWIIGTYCVVRGAMVLIVPHQFNIVLQAQLEPYFPWIASALILGGVALIAAAAHVLPPLFAVFAHLLAGGAIVQLAYSSALTGAWNGFASFLLLGLGVAAGGLLAPGAGHSPPERASARTRRIDLFALIMAISAVLTGVIFCTTPSQFATPLYDPVRPYLVVYGIAYIIAGGLLVAVLLYPSASRPLFIAGHLLTGGAMIAWTVGLGLPNWSSLLYNVGLGTAIALLPWLGPALDRIDPAQLRVRVALALASGVVLPLIVAVAIITVQEERSATEQALTLQRTLAVAMAEELSRYVGLHRAAAAALASTPGLAEMPPAQQHALLARFAQAYPDVALFAIFDAAGGARARSDEQPLGPGIAGRTIYEAARRTSAPSVEIYTGEPLGSPVLEFGAPVRGPNDQFAGLVVVGLRAEQIVAQIERLGGGLQAEAYLVDERGRVIAQPNAVPAPGLPGLIDRSSEPAVAALLASRAPGALRSIDSDSVRLAAYAPLPDLGWGMVIARPATLALSGVYARRDSDFGVLLLVTIGLLFAGTLVARWLVRPLATLSRATGRLAAGDDRAPLPQSGIAEVASLAGAFGDMRTRLAERTGERDAAEAKVQLLAEAGSILAGSLDYETTLANIARLLVSGLADYCVIDMFDDSGALQRIVTAHADPAGEALVRRLRDYPPDLEGDTRIARVLRTGVPDILPTIADATLAALARDDEHLRLMRALDLASLMTVTLSARKRMFGAISLARTSKSPRYAPVDLLLADELARRAALALDNARLYREAQAAIGLRDQFLSIASHELKTPLTVLLGNAQLLERRLAHDQQVTERHQQAIALIAERAIRLNRMIGVLLDIARIQGNQLTIEHAPVDLHVLTRRVIDELQPALDQHQLRYDGVGEALLVAGDELRLEQVFQNLIGNAVKYSPGGGTIDIHINRWHPDDAPADQRVRIAIADSGIGIPPESRDMLFERFYRAPNVDANQISGMGIGLYVVNEIVTLHGGTIEVESEVGSGSTFVVILPLLTKDVAVELIG
jgi:signal transduction histidine kinase